MTSLSYPVGNRIQFLGLFHLPPPPPPKKKYIYRRLSVNELLTFIPYFPGRPVHFPLMENCLLLRQMIKRYVYCTSFVLFCPFSFVHRVKHHSSFVPFNFFFWRTAVSILKYPSRCPFHTGSSVAHRNRKMHQGTRGRVVFFYLDQ